MTSLSQRQFKANCTAFKWARSHASVIGLVLIPLLVGSLIVGIYLIVPRISVTVRLADCYEVGALIIMDANGQHKLLNSESAKIVIKNNFTIKYSPAPSCPAKTGAVSVGRVLSPTTFQMNLAEDGSLFVNLTLDSGVYEGSATVVMREF